MFKLWIGVSIIMTDSFRWLRESVVRLHCQARKDSGYNLEAYLRRTNYGYLQGGVKGKATQAFAGTFLFLCLRADLGTFRMDLMAGGRSVELNWGTSCSEGCWEPVNMKNGCKIEQSFKLAFIMWDQWIKCVRKKTGPSSSTYFLHLELQFRTWWH